uniref:Uncharacterized protein n=1 Tax=Rhizophora mucronata TaxID=61149 RepID=A0A2P2QH15_RHIMU
MLFCQTKKGEHWGHSRIDRIKILPCIYHTI